jgi:hypothetical protein
MSDQKIFVRDFWISLHPIPESKLDEIPRSPIRPETIMSWIRQRNDLKRDLVTVFERGRFDDDGNMITPGELFEQTDADIKADHERFVAEQEEEEY